VAVEKITGTSDAMIRKHYYKVVEEKLKKKLANRRSLGNTELGNQAETGPQTSGE
jgi:hypothetical protein